MGKKTYTSRKGGEHIGKLNMGEGRKKEGGSPGKGPPKKAHWGGLFRRTYVKLVRKLITKEGNQKVDPQRALFTHEGLVRTVVITKSGGENIGGFFFKRVFLGEKGGGTKPANLKISKLKIILHFQNGKL